jgi:glucosyl-dolichyl phosphate glucuronosyltransferase
MSLAISIIIPTYNRCADLHKTLSSIMHLVDLGVSAEILVVDNGSVDRTSHVVRSFSTGFPFPVKYLYEPRNGLHNCRHTGAFQSRGELLIYIDDDVRVTDGWLTELTRPFENPNVSIVGGKIKPEWEALPPSWIHSMPAGYLSLLDLGNEPLDLAWPQQVYGCNMAIRRSVLFTVGGFNPDGYSDTKFRWLRGDGETGLLRKVYAAGLRVRYEPSALLYHRIPSRRMSLSYFRTRAINQGISDSYTTLRSKRFLHLNGEHALNQKPVVLRLISKARQILGKKLNVMSLIRIFIVQLSYYAARAEYTWRFLFNEQLKTHVYRESYMLEEKGVSA